MNPSRGTLSFHRLFSIEDLGFRDPEPFVAPLIREFLKIGEAVAGRWIELPDAILVFQMVAGVEDSGAIYLYDRRRHVFYLLCFEGPDDHLTLQEFEQILAEYNLLQFAEQPRLAEPEPVRPPNAHTEMPDFSDLRAHTPEPGCLEVQAQAQFQANSVELVLEIRRCVPPILDEWYLASGRQHVWFQTAGSA